MKLWNKKNISKDTVHELVQKYGLDPISASILTRRGITQGSQILYYLEKDRRFLHNPFCFSSMEDAVDRILQAQDEGEIVLIFGDRDVDGISSTTILYEQLISMGINVEWRLPSGNDGYGLSIEAVNEFYKKNGTLIITVDCGISNNAEIAHAAELGIDVIVLDHHNPPEEIPSPAIIVDPKCNDSQYPFTDISGAAVAYKTVLALRFTKSNLYKQEICLLNIEKNNDSYEIDCLKIRNLVIQKTFHDSISLENQHFSPDKFLKFINGQQIFVWNKNKCINLFKECLGNGFDFNFFDLENEISSLIPQVKGLTLSQLKEHSKIAKYLPSENSEIHGFFNIFVTYVTKLQAKNFPEDVKQEEKDLQLVSLAALADIMPLQDENRILVGEGVRIINTHKPRPGLIELLSKLRLLGTSINSTKLSWNVVPVLNATGRLGKPELGMKLFLEKDAKERDKIADKIIELNNQRKQLGNEAWFIGQKYAQESIRRYGNKLCVVIDEQINRGVSGILAGKLVSTYNVPAMAITFVDETAIGSMRSCRNFMIPPFLSKMSDIFINHGGHNQAGGFSFEKKRLDEFLERLEMLVPQIQLDEQDSKTIEIDAQIPHDFLNRDLLKVIDQFEPYGETNPELIFLSENLRIIDAQKMGKPDPLHLKLTLDAGKTKWPAIFFGEAQKLGTDFNKGDCIDILYQLQRNSFNGNVTPQIILNDTKLSK